MRGTKASSPSTLQWWKQTLTCLISDYVVEPKGKLASVLHGTQPSLAAHQSSATALGVLYLRITCRMRTSQSVCNARSSLLRARKKAGDAGGHYLAMPGDIAAAGRDLRRLAVDKGEPSAERSTSEIQQNQKQQQHSEKKNTRCASNFAAQSARILTIACFEHFWSSARVSTQARRRAAVTAAAPSERV
jgi:hypothetical protein